MIGTLLILSLFLFAPLCSLEIVEGDGEEIVSEILAVQKALLLPLDVTEIPEFAKSGFLTVAMTPEYVQACEKRVLAYVDGKVVGYVILETIERFKEWAEGREFTGDLGPLSNFYTIDQIGVLTPYARQGVGTALVNYAKKLSPGGLLTDAVLEPYPNLASMAFFQRQGFRLLGTMEIKATELLPAHKTSVFLLA